MIGREPQIHGEEEAEMSLVVGAQAGDATRKKRTRERETAYTKLTRRGPVLLPKEIDGAGARADKVAMSTTRLPRRPHAAASPPTRRLRSSSSR